MALDGEHAITSSWDTQLRVWDCPTAAPKKTFGKVQRLQAHVEPVTAVARVAEGYVISGDVSGQCKVFTRVNGEPLFEYPPLEEEGAGEEDEDAAAAADGAAGESNEEEKPEGEEAADDAAAAAAAAHGRGRPLVRSFIRSLVQSRSFYRSLVQPRPFIRSLVQSRSFIRTTRAGHLTVVCACAFMRPAHWW